MWPFEEEERAIRSGWQMAMLLMFPFFLLCKLIEWYAETRRQEPTFPQPDHVNPWNCPPPPRPADEPRQQRTESRPPPATPPKPKTDPLDEYRRRLGVAKDNTQEEIKKRYRFMSHAFHPDKFPEAQKPVAEEEFKKINESFRVLSDPDAQARVIEAKQYAPAGPSFDRQQSAKPKYW